MTAPMPDPVAFAVTHKLYPKDGPALHADASFAVDDDDLLIESLITTTQAEAYADARVREALEASFDKSFSLLSAWLRSTQAVADMGQVATLTSLVEFALTNQGKTSDQLEAEYQLPASPTE